MDWVKSLSEEPKESDDESDIPSSVFTRTQGEGYPAAWIGGGAYNEDRFGGVFLCTNLLDLRGSIYIGNEGSEPWKQALVGLGNGDVVLHVEGDLPIEPGNDSIEVSAYRVKDRQKAASSEGKGVVEIESLKARRLFFKLLRKHPKIGEGLSSKVPSGRCFVEDGENSPDTTICEGVLKGIDSDDGYGFIESEKLARDIYVPANEVEESGLRPGDSVQVGVVETTRGPKARNLQVS